MNDFTSLTDAVQLLPQPNTRPIVFCDSSVRLAVPSHATCLHLVVRLLTGCLARRSQTSHGCRMLAYATSCCCSFTSFPSLLPTLQSSLDESMSAQRALGRALEEGRKRDTLVLRNQQLESARHFDRVAQVRHALSNVLHVAV